MESSHPIILTPHKHGERLSESAVYGRTERFDVSVKVESCLCALGNTLRCELELLRSKLGYDLIKGTMLQTNTNLIDLFVWAGCTKVVETKLFV